MPLNLLFILLILQLLTACQTAPVRPRNFNFQSPPQPKWINQPPNDSPLFLYGSGQARSKKEAIQEALADLSSKLGITVSSHFKTQLNVTKRSQYEYFTRDSEKQIETEVKAFMLNQYQIEDTYSPSPLQFHVLLKTNKLSLYSAYKNELEKIIADYTSTQALSKKAPFFQRYQHACQAQRTRKDFHRKLLVAQTLKPTMDIRIFQNYENTVLKRYQRIKNLLSFKVQPKNTHSIAFAHALSGNLAKINSLKKLKPLKVKVESSVKLNKTNGFYLAYYTVNINVYDAHSLISSNHFSIKAASLQNTAAIKDQALKKFRQQLNTQNPWLNLGLDNMQCDY